MIRMGALAGIALLMAGTAQRPTPTLAERLGFKATDRILILNGDDAGNSHAANVATIDCLERGLMTSATIMVPCPWFPEIARYAKEHPEKDFGLHLTHTSEWKTIRWGPIASREQVPGLLDPDGYLWPAIEDVYKSATVEQAVTEARAQIKKALAAGIDVTHIDSHMGAMQLHPAYHAAYNRLAKEFNIPLRMASQETYTAVGFPNIRADAAALGLVFPDALHYNDPQRPGESRKEYWTRVLKALKPGVTEILIHAAKDTEELRAFTGTWEERSADYRLFTDDQDIRALMEQEGIKRIGFRALRDLQRGEVDRKTAGK